MTEIHICPICYGEGKVARYEFPRRYFPTNNPNEIVTCYGCNGKGYIHGY